MSPPLLHPYSSQRWLLGLQRLQQMLQQLSIPQSSRYRLFLLSLQDVLNWSLPVCPTQYACGDEDSQVSVPMQGAHQQSTPLPRLPQASDPTAVPPLTTAVAPATSVSSSLPAPPLATPPSPMITIGKLTAERLHDVDQESTQLPCDMVPSAHYVVDALGRRGTKSHNHVLSQWGHVSTGGKGEHISLKRIEGHVSSSASQWVCLQRSHQLL